MPSCNITICDNESTDNSVKIAKELGCSVLSHNSNNISNEDIKISIRNNIWKTCESGWIIMADMDEFVCVTEDELMNERKLGTSILKIQGYEMIGESKTLDLSDINLHEIKKYVTNDWESKHICFLREAITDMNFGPGSHKCNPKGRVTYSSKTYINKHMNSLGLNYLIDKIKNRYERTHQNRKKGWSRHYAKDIHEIESIYINRLNTCSILS
jgi:hypothetical protein